MKNDILNKPIGIIDTNGYERINRVYFEKGYSPCITSRDYKDPIKILVYEERNNTIRQLHDNK